LIEAARTLDIRVLDHVVVAGGGHASIREQGPVGFGQVTALEDTKGTS
jgi:hypothetical protein